MTSTAMPDFHIDARGRAPRASKHQLLVMLHPCAGMACRPCKAGATKCCSWAGTWSAGHRRWLAGTAVITAGTAEATTGAAAVACPEAFTLSTGKRRAPAACAFCRAGAAWRPPRASQAEIDAGPALCRQLALPGLVRGRETCRRLPARPWDWTTGRRLLSPSPSGVWLTHEN